MKQSVARMILFSALGMLSSASAYALCIDTGATGLNDVAIVGGGCSSLGPANNAAACDMNGLQRGLPTHGQFSVVYDPVPPTINNFWASWTLNGPTSTEEYVCKLDPVDLAGDGWVHILSGDPAGPMELRRFNCRVISGGSCPP